jgi:hypothetical protein
MPNGHASTGQSSDELAGSRLHIHGIKEMPASYDAEVAELFRDFRAASNLSEADLAARLNTRVEVVQALEQGALFALPPWAETYRVVNSYGLLLNLDVRPLLRRIYAQVDAGVVELKTRPMPDVPFMTPPDFSEPGAAANAGAPPPRRARSLQPPRPQAAQPQAVPPPPKVFQRPPPPRPNATTRAPMQSPTQDRRAQPRLSQAEAAKPKPQPQKAAAPAPAKRKSALLKWGALTLLVLGLGVGLWMLLHDAGLFGPATPQMGQKAGSPGKPFDPDDPRNRKADRLPSAGGF